MLNQNETGALVHMFGNLLGSQLLSPYTTEISMTIRYTKMVFFMIIILYAIFSKKFKNEVAEQNKENSSDKIGNQ